MTSLISAINKSKSRKYKMSSSSSSTPERPVKRGRGRSGSLRGRGRTGVRTRGGRSPEDNRATDALRIVQSRRQRMKDRIAKMDEQKMREILLELVEVQPALMFDVMEPPQQQPGGHHPSPDTPSPDWCVCLKCREMPTDMERVCCEKAPTSCISLLPDFQVLILDEAVLALARLHRQDVLVIDEGADIRKANRHAAYRQFVLWSHGRLGAGNRVVIPSCCVWSIRDKYPDAFGQYKGFSTHRLV